MSDDILPPEEIDTQEHEINVADATDLPYEDESFHAIVTDPPYNFEGGFMGEDWDNLGSSKQYQKFCEQWASETLRILKPGGHLVAFSGQTQFHRLMCGVEDAGFDMRETVMWLFGNGFPKSLDISKAIDKKLDKEDEREVIGKKTLPNGEEHDYNIGYSEGKGYNSKESERLETSSATDIAKEWEGWKTGLKPGFEPIIIAQKPLEEDTFAEQVMATGTGGLNIDGCRIDTDESWEGTELPNAEAGNALEGSVSGELNEQTSASHDNGRFPANVILDAEAAQMLDAEVGELGESKGVRGVSGEKVYGEGDGYLRSMDADGGQDVGFGDKGGPSRYFYTSKASKAERTANGKIDNNHPTVKPVDLMQYLVRLVTAEGQKVCDPFLGSGTTLLACEEEDRIGYGSDMNKEYCDIATKRLGIRLGTELGSFMDY